MVVVGVHSIHGFKPANQKATPAGIRLEPQQVGTGNPLQNLLPTQHNSHGGPRREIFTNLIKPCLTESRSTVWGGM